MGSSPKLVAFVFKFIGSALILMVLFDTTMTFIDALSTHTRLQTIADMMQQDIARHNCLTESAEDMFDTMLEDIDSRSAVYDSIRVSKDQLAESRNAWNVRNYGEMHRLEIKTVVTPLTYIISAEGGKQADNLVQQATNVGFELSYVYDVPCLRYLK